MKCDCANCTTHACYTKGVNCTGIDPLDVLDAYTALTQAAVNAGVPVQQINEQIREMITSTQPGNSLVKTILARHLSN